MIELAHQLAEKDYLEYVEPDMMGEGGVVPDDPRFSEQRGLAQIGAPGAWDVETGSASNVLIGIIDSGISMTSLGVLDHPDLRNPWRFIIGSDFVDGGSPRDLHGHGTHVAGIAAAEADNSAGIAGMNWKAPVYICRALDASSRYFFSAFADAVEEIVDYAVSRGMKAVINFSAGSNFTGTTQRDACQYADDNGMLICVCVHNDAGRVRYPAAHSKDIDAVIAVGSTDDDGKVSSFSNVGPEVTVVAPGRRVLSTTPTYPVTAFPIPREYGTMSGTSMSTPLVTGLVALMWGRHPGFSHRKIRQGLTSTASKLGTSNFDNSWGFGRIDAEKAVRFGDPVTTPFTPFTRFTGFTRLPAPVTRFTGFTRLPAPVTRFTGFTPAPDSSSTGSSGSRPFTPGPTSVQPLIRVGNLVFDSGELEVGHFEELAGVAAQLRTIGIEHLHDLAATDVCKLSTALNDSREHATELVGKARQMLASLSESG